MVEDASRRPGRTLNQARRVADRKSATGGQAMDGLSAGLKALRGRRAAAGTILYHVAPERGNNSIS